MGRMQSTSICDNCSGTGKIVTKKPPGSDANGQILVEETVDVKIVIVNAVPTVKCIK